MHELKSFFTLSSNFLLVSFTFLVLINLIPMAYYGWYTLHYVRLLYLSKASLGFSLPNNNQHGCLIWFIRLVRDKVAFPLLEECISYCHFHSCTKLKDLFPFISNSITTISMLVLKLSALLPTRPLKSPAMTAIFFFPSFLTTLPRIS